MSPLHLTSLPRTAKASVATSTLILLSAAAAPGVAPGRPAAPQGGEVFVVQGVPGSAVDVKLDGDSLRSDLQAEGIIGPLTLEAGDHTIAFAGDDWSISSAFQVADASTDIVLHWPADVTDEPEVTVFTNDVAPIASGKGRLTVAHTAVVPPADVRVDDKVLFANIANGEFISSEVAADTYSVDVVPTGQSGPPLLGPVALPVKAGQLTRVFAIGEPRDGSMSAVIQTLPLSATGSPAPDEVAAGSAGLVATPVNQTADERGQLVLAVCFMAAVGMLLTAVRRRLQ